MLGDSAGGEHRWGEGAASTGWLKEVVAQMQNGRLLEQQCLLQYSKGIFIPFP